MCNYNIICVIISLWTVIQTAFHLVVIVYGYYMKICAETPKQASTIFFYLTYLYESRCGKLEIKSSQVSLLENLFSTIFNMVAATEDTESLTAIIEEILLKANLPPSVVESPKTFVYFVGFIVMDSAWIVTSAGLLMASWCRIKETFSLFFYVPWLVTTISLMLFDIIGTIHFGFDLTETLSFHNWLKFVGISNPDDLKDLDVMSTSKKLPTYPTISIMLLTSRGGIIWILNLISFILVYKAARIAYKQTYKTENKSFGSSPTSQEPTLGRHRSEDRIKSWQLFYGTADIMTGVTTSSPYDSSQVMNTDINSNKPPMHKEPNISSSTFVVQRESQYYPSSSCTTPTTRSCSSFPYSDVSDGVVDNDGEHIVMKELKSQGRFFYFPEESREKLEEKVTEITDSNTSPSDL